MKHFFTFLFSIFIFCSYAQSPKSFNYQGVARNSDGTALSSTEIAILIELKSGNAGSVLYSENHLVTTNDIGLFAVHVGRGSVNSGNFDDIDWSLQSVQMTVSIDPSGGTSYTEMGTVELLSVPYALYAARSPGDDDADPENEIQTLNFQNDSLFISGANGVDLSPFRDEEDTLNELQSLIYEDYELTISEGNTVDLSDLKDTANISLATLLTENNNTGGKTITGIPDPVDNTDAVPKSYVDALLARIEALENKSTAPQPVLWNKLGSVNEVENSEVGPNGEIVGTVNFSNDVKFNKGVTPNDGNAGSGIDFPTTIADPDSGCIELWVEFFEVPVAFQYGVYGFVNVGHWRPPDGPDNVLVFSWHNDNSMLYFSLKFNGTNRALFLENFSPELNEPIHLACVWNREGINDTGDYMQIYMNGVLQVSDSEFNDWGDNNTLGEFRVATPWDADYAVDRYAVDNIKVWDFSKTDFSDRFIE